MGKKPRQRPQRLGEKLLAIRNALALSQSQMVNRLDVEGIVPSQISEFETGKREPSLIVVLQYARLAGICADVLIDDKLNLPAKLPAKSKRS
ncbi:MAG TPA: helix-turn-helix transcriptional regulator [Pyrinomonadaceae bacterium]|jgi:transcriptional regulator with XRE-family HTH domain